LNDTFVVDTIDLLDEKNVARHRAKSLARENRSELCCFFCDFLFVAPIRRHCRAAVQPIKNDAVGRVRALVSLSREGMNFKA